MLLTASSRSLSCPSSLLVPCPCRSASRLAVPLCSAVAWLCFPLSLCLARALLSPCLAPALSLPLLAAPLRLVPPSCLQLPSPAASPAGCVVRRAAPVPHLLLLRRRFPPHRGPIENHSAEHPWRSGCPCIRTTSPAHLAGRLPTPPSRSGRRTPGQRPAVNHSPDLPVHIISVSPGRPPQRSVSIRSHSVPSSKTRRSEGSAPASSTISSPQVGKTINTPCI